MGQRDGGGLARAQFPPEVVELSVLLAERLASVEEHLVEVLTGVRFVVFGLFAIGLQMGLELLVLF